MADVFDVAAYILNKQGRMTTMKLQKLCYYAQAWHLVWAEKPLFDEPIQAWANGPVCPELYQAHKGKFDIDARELPQGNPQALTDRERRDIDEVLRFYAPMGAYHLSELTHHEDPWKDARGDLPVGARCNTVITLAAMAEYYGSITD
jgi:uncharacterized phage-associated protein